MPPGNLSRFGLSWTHCMFEFKSCKTGTAGAMIFWHPLVAETVVKVDKSSQVDWLATSILYAFWSSLKYLQTCFILFMLTGLVLLAFDSNTVRTGPK